MDRLETCRLPSGGVTIDAVRRTTRSQCRLVLDFLCNASAWLGLRGNRDSVAGDCGNDSGVLQVLENRRLVDGAVFGMGQLCQRIELHDLAIECRLKHLFVAVHEISNFVGLEVAVDRTTSNAMSQGIVEALG